MNFAPKNPRRRLLRTCLFSALALGMLAPLAAHADSKDGPIGTWKTIDDETGQAKAIVQVYEYRGKLYGKIVKLLNKKQERPLCHKCSGAKKDQPIEGMVIVWGLEVEDAKQWDDGHILDPAKGKVYDCALKLSADGKRLEVRGYKGWSAIGRSQTWQRAN